MDTYELYRTAVSTPKLCLKTQITKTIMPLILWDSETQLWHKSIQKTMYTTWNIDAIYCSGVIPPVVLLALESPDKVIDFLLKHGTKPTLIIASRAILMYAPTIVDDLQLKNILFVEDLATLYEFLPEFTPSIADQALVAAILLRRHVIKIPASMQTAIRMSPLADFYKTHVGTFETFMEPPNDIVLIQQYFNHHTPARQEEFNKCLLENIKNPFIDKIVLLIEDGTTAPIHPKIAAINIHKRMTFADAMRWAKDNLAENIYFIIANLDIYFDDTLAELYDISMRSTCLALLRHDVGIDGTRKIFGPRPDSQDAWIFQLPLPDAVNVEDPAWNITLGYPGCDNSIAYELVQHRFMVANPAHSINVLHIHNTAIRNYTVDNVVIRPKYVHIQPTTINVYAQRVINIDSKRFKTLSDAFINPQGELYDFKGKWDAVQPAASITRCLSTKELIATPCKPADMQNPYLFMYNVFPRILCGLEMFPEAECRIPDLPPLFASLLSHVKWPTETIKTIPYHEHLHVWSKKIHVIPPFASSTKKTYFDKALSDLYDILKAENPHIMSNRSKHIACTNAGVAEYIRTKSTGIAWNGVKTIDFTMNFVDIIKYIRTSDIIVVSNNSQNTHLCWMFSKPDTRIIDMSETDEMRCEIEEYGLEYVWHGPEYDDGLVEKIEK